MKYCYIRVSRDTQEFDRQVQIFKDRGYLNGVNCTYIEEKFTGTKINRPEFTRLLDTMVEGDTLVVESLSRLSKYPLVSFLYSEGVLLTLVYNIKNYYKITILKHLFII